MNTSTKTLLAGATVLVALLALAGPATASALQSPGGTVQGPLCAIERALCFCASGAPACESTQGNHCLATVGPDDQHQTGVLCS